MYSVCGKTPHIFQLQQVANEMVAMSKRMNAGDNSKMKK